MLHNETITRAIKAAWHTPLDPAEAAHIAKAIWDSYDSPRRDAALFGALCYSAGLAEGKHQERQRRGKVTIPANITTGDYYLRVTGNALAPDFRDGDLVLIRAAACTADLMTRQAVVISQGSHSLIGRLTINKDGSANLIHGGRLVPFDRERDFIGPVVAVWRSLEPAKNLA